MNRHEFLRTIAASILVPRWSFDGQQAEFTTCTYNSAGGCEIKLDAYGSRASVRKPAQIETAEIHLPRQYRELFQDFTATAVKGPTAVRLGDLMWTTFPGEMFSNIGRQVKAGSPATYPHVMGYTNGYIGYFPEQKAYAEGGYEVAVTHLDPASERIYLRAIADLMKRFR